MKRPALLATLCAASSLVCSPGATAQEIEDGALTPKDNVIVTGHLMPATVPQISSAFSEVGRLQFEQRQSIFAADLLRDLPSLAVSRSGTFGSKTAIRLRGAEANQVMVMIDGIRVNDIARDDAFDFSNLTSYDIERIEVLRGPQSALYGSDAAAGVINVITRRAEKPLDVQGFLDGGSFNTLNAGVRVGAAGRTSNISAGASWLKTDGTNISRIGTEKDGYDNLTATINAGVQATDRLYLDFVGRYVDTQNDFDDGCCGPPVDNLFLRTESQQAYLQGRGELSVLDGLWLHELRLSLVTTDNENFDPVQGNLAQTGQKTNIYFQTSLGLDGTPASESHHQLTLAVDHFQENFEQRGPVGFGDPNKDESLNNTGYVVEYRAQPAADWALSLAVRYDDNSDFKNVATYRATTSYHFDRTDTRLRSTLGTGQKNPTFTERFGFFASSPSTFIGNGELKPEESRGWDIGVDQGFFDGRLMISATYFNEELDNEINGFVQVVPGSTPFCPCTAINEDGISDRKGLELWLDAAAGAGFAFKASYTYTDATQPDGLGAMEREIRRPRHMAALSVNRVFAGNRGNLNFNVAYTGEQSDDDFSTFSRVELDAYTLVDLAASYALTKSVTLTTRVENLFDENYESVFGFVGPGRGAYVGVRMTFAN